MCTPASLFHVVCGIGLFINSLDFGFQCNIFCFHDATVDKCVLCFSSNVLVLKWISSFDLCFNVDLSVEFPLWSISSNICNNYLKKV